MLLYMDTIMTLQPIIVTRITTQHTIMKETEEESLMEDFLTTIIEEPIVKQKIEEIILDKTTDTITILSNTEITIKETTIIEETVEERTTETTDTEETVVV